MEDLEGIDHGVVEVLSRNLAGGKRFKKKKKLVPFHTMKAYGGGGNRGIAPLFLNLVTGWR
jgi:hypothetical protein